VGHPAEDPHGHPIPDRAGQVRQRALTPLSSLPSGARATVREIRDTAGPRMARWKQVGLVPGAVVHVRQRQTLEDVFELVIGGKRLITGSEGLEGILVETQARAR